MSFHSCSKGVRHVSNSNGDKQFFKLKFYQMEKVIKALEKVEGNSIWHIAIRNTLEDYKKSKDRLGLLVISLQEQNKDDPKCMERILGDSYTTIMDCYWKGVHF